MQIDFTSSFHTYNRNSVTTAKLFLCNLNKNSGWKLSWSIKMWVKVKKVLNLVIKYAKI